MTTASTEPAPDGHILKDWHARNYLDFYYAGYREVPTDEIAMFAFIASGLRDIGKRLPAGIELGCGPVLHHAAQLTPWVDRLDMADYQESNLDEIRHWIQKAPGFFDWSVFFDGPGGVLDAEKRTLGNLADREAAMRSRIHLMRCDLRDDQPLGHAATYPIVTCYYCAEWVIPTIEGWRETMRRVCSLVAAGGWLFMVGVHETSWCIVNDKRMPCAPVTDDELRSTLTRLGFDLSTYRYSVTPGLKPEVSGIHGTFMFCVQRSG